MIRCITASLHHCITASLQDMENILKHLNTTASWFGDPSLHDDEVSKLVDDVFEKHDAEKSGTLTYSEYMHAVAENPILVQFFNGKGSIPRPNKAKVLLPIWWVDYNLKFEGELKGKGVEFLKCDEFRHMVMDCKKYRACKSSWVIANLAEGDAELLDLRQEWHGPFDDKTFLDSDFAKKVEATEGGEALRGSLLRSEATRLAAGCRFPHLSLPHNSISLTSQSPCVSFRSSQFRPASPSTNQLTFKKKNRGWMEGGAIESS